EPSGEPRNVYVNYPLGVLEVSVHGEPIARYERNKVRTTNLCEQFRRSNLFSLTLVVIQRSFLFDAASGAILVLPLAFILTVTDIKDAVEDYRRETLDEEVKTSATTKSGSWRNVNQPTDPRPWFEKMLGINPPGKVTKGVRKLRDREANEAGHGVRVMLSKTSDTSTTSFDLDHARSSSGWQLDDIQRAVSHSYPPDASSLSDTSTQRNSTTEFRQLKQNDDSQSTLGVIDSKRRNGG
ncbi:uncharacterized protein BT62DRAFT_867926, partial [Guyanagaster necrorhizus]